MPEDLGLFDRIRTETRLFLMGNRELIVLFGVLLLAASVIYSTKIISLPVRVPTRATVLTPAPVIFPAITESASSIRGGYDGFLELLEVSPALSPTVALTPSPTPFTPTPTDTGSTTIFLPPVPR